MNAFKIAIFGYRKFIDTGGTPRLNFHGKFRKSAYPDGKLHPALQALLYYTYKVGQLDPLCMIVFNDDDKKMLEILLKKLKKGKWRTLDEIVNSPMVAMAAIHEYLKSFKKGLWKKVKPEEWGALWSSLQGQSDKYLDSSVSTNPMEVAQKIFKGMKPEVRHFSVRLLKVLNKLTTKCDEEIRTTAAFRLAEYFLPVLVKNVKSTRLTYLSLHTCVFFLVFKAPLIFRRYPPNANTSLTP